ncbi:MAG TPA: hypothetical protein VGM86_35340 [Thermoanaerobaculia bacterium]
MKLRSMVLVLALLLIASLASAAQTQTATPADPAAANLAAIFAAPAPPDGGTAKLPSFEPTPSEKALTCGSCSDAPCVGAQVGTVCKFQNGQTYTCQHAYVICTFRDCECWTGPLP